jgi:hypothetical protein
MFRNKIQAERARRREKAPPQTYQDQRKQGRKKENRMFQAEHAASIVFSYTTCKEFLKSVV